MLMITPWLGAPLHPFFHVVRSIKPHTIQTRIAVQLNDSTTPRMITKSGHVCVKRRQREANCDERPWYGLLSVISMLLHPGSALRTSCPDAPRLSAKPHTKQPNT
jgi:hypothetical protein